MKIYCDFDGTITKYDLLDRLIEYQFGKYYRTYNDSRIIKGELDHDKYVMQTFKKFNMTFKQALDILEDPIESTFEDFFNKCKKRGINIYIISSGFRQLIQHFLPYVPVEQIYANDLRVEEKNWDVSIWKLSKHRIIKDLHENETTRIIYMGDGISDFEMTKYADTLFVKKNSDLETYCMTNVIPHYKFNSFDNIKI